MKPDFPRILKSNGILFFFFRYNKGAYERGFKEILDHIFA